MLHKLKITPAFCKIQLSLTDLQKGAGMITDNQIVEFFTLVDDFILKLNQEVIPRKRKRGFPALSESEVVTICLLFQFSGFRHFKDSYTGYVQKFLKPYFPKLLSQ